MVKCYHCGDDCNREQIDFDSKSFCCHGCKTVYEIFSGNDLAQYYELQSHAGSSPVFNHSKYEYLDNADIVEKLVDFDDEGIQVVNLNIPQMHCSSCIWVLENLNRLNGAVKNSLVDFPKKTVQITYDTKAFSLKGLVTLLAKIGYEPYISLENLEKKKPSLDRKLIYRLGLAGFAFGNVMLLSFPEYFEVEEFWLERYKVVFRWLMFFFSVPVVLYSASDYFKSAYHGLSNRLLNIDVPIALGILVLFLRSTFDIVFDLGSGFFDSLTGLVFFLLLGKFFQQKTYAFLSFERDYKSYFPIAVTRIAEDGHEENIQIYKVRPGDRLLIRSQELLPVDCTLLKGKAEIDYSFVTGESASITKEAGDKLFAGGRQLSGVVEVEALKEVSQSYLTELWAKDVFNYNKDSGFQTLTDGIGKRFTIAVLTIALLSSVFWMFYEPSKVLNVFTAVLIIACPCAIALAAPFTLGNLLRIFGKYKFYLKNIQVIEKMAQIGIAVFDKTGTLTTSQSTAIAYEGCELTVDEAALLRTTLRASNHPLSRSLYALLKSNDIMTLDEFEEQTGQGLIGTSEGQSIKIGSAAFVGNKKDVELQGSEVYVSANDEFKGKFLVKNVYRTGVFAMLKRLMQTMSIGILSGDHNGEEHYLRSTISEEVPMLFGQKPKDKLHFIKDLQPKHKVLMVGDGLNDAGALAQSDVGVAVSENINVFSPACDAIIDASKLPKLDVFLSLSKKAIKVVRWSFVLSLCYNLVGLYFAVTGQLKPVMAAILMPLSSISIVVFTTVATNWIGRRLREESKESKT